MCIEIETSKLRLTFDKNIVENLKHLENKIILPFNEMSLTHNNSNSSLQIDHSVFEHLFSLLNSNCSIMTEMIEQQIKWEIWGRNKNILFKFYNKS